MCLLNVAGTQLAVTNNNQECSSCPPPVLISIPSKCNSLVSHSIPQYITVYYSISQYITVYHSILQYITVYHSIPQYTTVYHSIPQYITVYHSISQCITVYYQCVSYQAAVLMTSASATHGHLTSTHYDGRWSM